MLYRFLCVNKSLFLVTLVPFVVLKESESAEEGSISSEGERKESRVAPQAPVEGEIRDLWSRFIYNTEKETYTSAKFGGELNRASQFR